MTSSCSLKRPPWSAVVAASASIRQPSTKCNAKQPLASLAGAQDRARARAQEGHVVDSITSSARPARLAGPRRRAPSPPEIDGQHHLGREFHGQFARQRAAQIPFRDIGSATLAPAQVDAMCSRLPLAVGSRFAAGQCLAQLLARKKLLS
jgi:hypothetical protein